MKYYIIDAFADKLFAGNPAGVCILEEELDDNIMQSIAAENNLPETAFIKKDKDDYTLRWFTPEEEIDLCGHATLASAYVVMNFIDKDKTVVSFKTQSGVLTIQKNGDLYEMDFPSRPAKKTEITSLMKEAVGAEIKEAYIARDLVLVLENEESIRRLKPDMEKIKEIPNVLGVVVTAKGKEFDFVSRFFAPGVDMSTPEDPVTGSTHCNLIPLWSGKLSKRKMTAAQLSKRGGILHCEDLGDRVLISGKACHYLTGDILTNN